MTELSLEAQKAVEEANMRRRGWWPRLARTDSKLIVLRPRRGGGRSFARFMAAVLPGFVFNGQKNWWEATLDRTVYELAVAANTTEYTRELQLHLSDGVREWAGNFQG